MSQKTFTLTNDATGESFTYPVIESTRGPAGFDMRSFYRDTGHFSFDPGFTSTASCRSAITFIDGEKGELRYRGIPIEELAENRSYLEVCYLLLNGRLPDEREKAEYAWSSATAVSCPKGW